MKDVIEEIFSNKRNLLIVNPDSDRRDQYEIGKDGKCIIFLKIKNIRNIYDLS